MLNKKMSALLTSAALATCLFTVGCGSQAAPSTSAPEEKPAATETVARTDETTEAEVTTTEEKTEATAEVTAETKAPEATAPTADSYIGEDAAKQAALADAGLAAAEVTELEAELDLDDAVVHYDVEFKSGGMEYDYDVDATTGSILNAHSEVDD